MSRWDGYFLIGNLIKFESLEKGFYEELSKSGCPIDTSVKDCLECITWGGNTHLLWVVAFPGFASRIV